jgi:peptidyl-tRNA hydrolase, PTH1 family
LTIIGLGNPGKTYARTRHNLGFRAIDLILKDGSLLHSSKRKLYCAWDIRLDGHVCTLVKSRTFMNESGRAVQSLCTSSATTPDDLLVIYDDANLPLGKLRIRRKGSSGGHKGVQSIIDLLGTQEFARIKLGIGAPGPGQDLVDYVLTGVLPAETGTVEEMLTQSVTAVKRILTDGIESAMTAWNG